MAKVTAADLKKHHYWILAGVAPLFALLAALFLYLNVSESVAKEQAETDKEVKAVSDTRPKGTKALADYEAQKKKLDEQKTKLHAFSYDNQKAMFKWPNGPRLQLLEARYPKFGQPIVREDDSIGQIAREEYYETAYDELARSVLPTQLAGGWKGVLRYVSQWGTKVPSDKQLWLALEDLWVQRGLLGPVNEINAAASRFVPVPPADKKDDPFKRTFQSRVWTLELEVPRQATNGQRLIECRLTNRTDRLQVLGADNTMNLLLTLAPGAPETLYRISAPLVPAGQTVEVRLPRAVADTPERERLKKSTPPMLREVQASTRYHAIQPGVEPTGVLAVRQRLDARNVPVRRVDDVVMGAGAKDARHFPAELKPPKWYAEPPAGTAPAGAGAVGSPGGSMSTGSGDGETGGRAGGAVGLGGLGGSGGGASGPQKTGGPTAVLDANRLRYIDVTDQVRRMPVGLVLVVDQMFVQDALAAYANSPLRFQVTQFHWSRFRGTLDTPGSALTAGGGLGSGGAPAGGGFGSGGGGMAEGGTGMTGSPDGGLGDAGSGGRGGLGSGGGSPVGGFGGGFGGSTESEQQVTSGLVVLSLYGIVTLYEKYDAPAAAPAADATAAPAAPAPAAKE